MTETRTMEEKTLRESRASVALICRHHGDDVQWLARWNKNWSCYYFVGGHKHDDETYYECLVRELKEELGITGDKDFSALEEPVARLEYTAWSKSGKVRTECKAEVSGVKTETQYTVELFDVRFVSDLERLQAQSNQALRWLSEEEIRSKKCKDGLAVSETMGFLLDKIDWNCPCVLSDRPKSQG